MGRFSLCLVLGLSASDLPAQVTAIPSGTVVVVRTVDAIDSQTAEPGKTFRATLDAPLIINGQQAAGKGRDATLKIMEVAGAGRIKGQAQLTISLVSLQGDQQPIAVTSAGVTMQSEGKGKSTAKKTGLGAALGAGVGALAGGGKGAGIGAAVGGGAGVAWSTMTAGPRVQIRPEAVLSFQIQSGTVALAAPSPATTIAPLVAESNEPAPTGDQLMKACEAGAGGSAEDNAKFCGCYVRRPNRTNFGH